MQMLTVTHVYAKRINILFFSPIMYFKVVL